MPPGWSSLAVPRVNERDDGDRSRQSGKGSLT
jgi:hypothetical protein